MRWIPSMTSDAACSLPYICSYMPKKRLHHIYIQKKMVSISSSKRGYISKTPKVPSYSVHVASLDGIGDHHVYFEHQGVGQTLQLLKHIRSAAKLGSFLQIGLDWTQLHAGVSFPILTRPKTALPHLESSIVVSLSKVGLL